MADWKSALSAIGAKEGENETLRVEVERKRRVGVVYSTNPDFVYNDDSQDVVSDIPKSRQRLRVNIERAGRGGKTVTIVKGFIGADEELDALCRLLKRRCGVGGSVKDGEIIIQGEKRQTIVDILKNEGFPLTK
ncbi:MAG: translation initiation factor [Candidatus Limimorpha sp.]